MRRLRWMAGEEVEEKERMRVQTPNGTRSPLSVRRIAGWSPIVCPSDCRRREARIVRRGWRRPFNAKVRCCRFKQENDESEERDLRNVWCAHLLQDDDDLLLQVWIGQGGFEEELEGFHTSWSLCTLKSIIMHFIYGARKTAKRSANL